MKDYEYLWKIMNIYERLWIFMKDYEYLWKTMNIYERLWIFMKDYEYLWETMNIYERLWIFMKDYDYARFLVKTMACVFTVLLFLMKFKRIRIGQIHFNSQDFRTKFQDYHTDINSGYLSFQLHEYSRQQIWVLLIFLYHRWLLSEIQKPCLQNRNCQSLLDNDILIIISQ